MHLVIKQSKDNKSNVWMFTTPEELRELAINLERQSSASKLGQGLIAYEKKIDENNIFRIALKQ